MAKSGSNQFFWAFIVAGLLGIAWLFRDLWMPQLDTAEPPASTAPAETEPSGETAEPRHPIEPPSIERGEPRETEELPPLDDSDAYFLLAVASSFGPAVESLLVREAVIGEREAFGYLRSLRSRLG